MSARRRFRLYQTEQHWCSFADYCAILDATIAISPRTVLEFGPGWSTLALIEGGAKAITAVEDQPYWASVTARRTAAIAPGVVSVVEYKWCDPLVVPGIADGARFDLGLIDGPRETPRRPPVIAYCAARCDRLLVPLETDGGEHLALFVRALAARTGRSFERLETGPLAGAYGLIGPAS